MQSKSGKDDSGLQSILAAHCQSVVNKLLSMQVTQALGGRKSQIMAIPDKQFSEKIQKAGSGISLVTLVQVKIFGPLLF